MEADISARLDELEKKIDAVFVSTEKTRKYFLAIIVITVLAFVLPLIGLLFAIPSFMSSYSDVIGSDFMQGL
jgi:hypothetical protein